MSNKHIKNKKTLKVIGFICLIIGITCTIIGFASFFIAMNSGGMPNLFFFTFIGLPLMGVASTLLAFGYKREVTTYLKNEGVPVAKEVYQDIKPEMKDFVDTIKGKKEDEIICPSCHNVNSSNSKFCDKCGTPLTKRCPYCNNVVNSDSKFCSNCGTKLD